MKSKKFQSGTVRLTAISILSFVIAFAAISFVFSNHAAAAVNCQLTSTEFCTPFGVANDNYSLFPALSSTGAVSTILDTKVHITSTLTQVANEPPTQPGAELGCPPVDYTAFTYQNNFEGSSAQALSFYQEVLTVGYNNAPLGGTTPS